jgi:hypothetical protein
MLVGAEPALEVPLFTTWNVGGEVGSCAPGAMAKCARRGPAVPVPRRTVEFAQSIGCSEVSVRA